MYQSSRGRHVIECILFGKCHTLRVNDYSEQLLIIIRLLGVRVGIRFSTSIKYWPHSRIQHVYVRDCQWQLIKVSSSLKYFTRATKTCGLHACDSRFHSHIARVMSLLSLTRRDNERRGVHAPWLSQEWHKYVYFGNIAIVLLASLCILTNWAYLWLSRPVSHVEKKLSTLPEHLSP